MPYGMSMFLWTTDATGDRFAPLFEKLRAMGFDSVEIPIFAPDPPAYARLGKLLDGVGLARTAATALSAETDLIGPDPRQRRAGVEYLKGVIDSCRVLGTPILAGPIYAALGRFADRGPTAEEWARAVDGLRQAAEHARDTGVTLAAEYLNRFEIYLVNCAADAARLVREVGHPNLRMSYDTFHAHIEEKSVTAAIEACAGLLAHVQVSENDRSTPGRGQVRWDETFAALRKIGYAGSLTIEAFGERLPALAAATKIWRRMFESEEQLARDGLAFVKSRWEGR
jgi:D-psicose/D-tagatose/L-ribulose 3-epimerase